MGCPVKIWIICAGQSARPRRCDSAAFDALCAAEADAEIEESRVWPMQRAGRAVYVAPGRACRQTARLFFGEDETVAEPLLAAVPQRASVRSARALPLWLWLLLARLRELFGGKSEERRQAETRADALLGRLGAEAEDCVLICPLSFLRVLLDRLRVHGYCVSRDGAFRLKPLERFLVTRRDMHCGGCSHNCMLSNPGCGVGRDKAARNSG